MKKIHELDKLMPSMRAVGEMLIPLNHPLGDQMLEDEICSLKKFQMLIDGYALDIKFDKADYTDFFLESVQITGTNLPFLPFGLVVKIARHILGGHQLSLVEYFQENKKVYCWHVSLDDRGRPVPSLYENKSRQCFYEGFEYLYIEAKELSFH